MKKFKNFKEYKDLIKENISKSFNEKPQPKKSNDKLQQKSKYKLGGYF